MYPRQEVSRGGKKKKRRKYSSVGRNGETHSPFLVMKSLLISIVATEGDDFALV